MHYTREWLTSNYDSGEPLRFIFFWGHSKKAGQDVGQFVLSQWFLSPFTVDGIVYPTTEHWMMAWKASLFGDKTAFDKILAAKKPAEVKELGRQITGFDEIVWDKRRFEIVKIGNIHKFNQNPDLLKYLLGSGDSILVEASPTDSVWGIGLAQDSEMIDNPYTWNGQNLLGFALMEVRDFLKDFGNFNYITHSILPPWKKYPDINPLDMFWRMGTGEDYMSAFSNVFQGLSERDKKLYELSYPAMGDWAGFYSNEW